MLRIVCTRVASSSWDLEMQFQFCPLSIASATEALFCVFGQQNERHRNARLKEFRDQPECFRISGFMFKKNQAVRLLLQQKFCFLDGASVI